MIGYDNIPENENILLDLPFYEGGKIVTRDQAKPHHDGVNFQDPGGGSFSFAAEASGLTVPEFVTVGGGGTDGVYLDLDDALCADLDFTAGDYSLGVWVNWAVGATSSSIVMGRYVLNNNGWELYLTDYGGNLSLTLRHHHSGGFSERTGNFSLGWAHNVWTLIGVSRSGADAAHFRNGAVVPTTGSFEDPETCSQDLVIGCRYTKNADWFKGKMWRPRIWNEALTAIDWFNIFDKERDLFGV